MTDLARYFGKQDRDWILAEHITEPRPACDPSKRTPALLPPRGDYLVKTRQSPRRNRYPNVYPVGTGGWYFQFTQDGQKHYRGGYKTEDDAARGYNEYIAVNRMRRESIKNVGQD